MSLKDILENYDLIEYEGEMKGDEYQHDDDYSDVFTAYSGDQDDIKKENNNINEILEEQIKLKQYEAQQYKKFFGQQSQNTIIHTQFQEWQSSSEIEYIRKKRGKATEEILQKIPLKRGILIERRTSSPDSSLSNRNQSQRINQSHLHWSSHNQAQGFKINIINDEMITHQSQQHSKCSNYKNELLEIQCQIHSSNQKVQNNQESNILTEEEKIGQKQIAYMNKSNNPNRISFPNKYNKEVKSEHSSKNKFIHAQNHQINLKQHAFNAFQSVSSVKTRKKYSNKAEKYLIEQCIFNPRWKDNDNELLIQHQNHILQQFGDDKSFKDMQDKWGKLCTKLGITNEISGKDDRKSKKTKK